MVAFSLVNTGILQVPDSGTKYLFNNNESPRVETVEFGIIVLYLISPLSTRFCCCHLIILRFCSRVLTSTYLIILFIPPINTPNIALALY